MEVVQHYRTNFVVRIIDIDPINKVQKELAIASSGKLNLPRIKFEENHIYIYILLGETQRKFNQNLKFESNFVSCI